ncbi:MAG: tRNA pseudouridine(55) synthase TruB [Desulfobacteraceae bacterium]|nr:MAG: tRNA pseudouridine(55) synthase TruB [Desulfobacteraceae bacterium]
MDEVKDGILLIDKEPGEHSSGVVRKVKRLLKVKKVGHAGTLDPFASGLLIILVGKATCLSRFILAGSKLYRATLCLGVATDTLDLTGKVVRTIPVPRLEPATVEEKAKKFVGETWQIPPAFSAVKFRGKRAYSLARMGITPELQPRMIRVYSLKVLYSVGPVIEMEIKCSAGTYIRTLAADLAGELSSVGHLSSLRRIECTPFHVKNGINSRDLAASGAREKLKGAIIPMAHALPDMPAIEINKDLALSLRHGITPSIEELSLFGRDLVPGDGYLKILSHGNLTSIVRIYETDGYGKGKVSIERVFPSNNDAN